MVSWEQQPCRESGLKQRDLAQSDDASEPAEAQLIQEASQHHLAGVLQAALLEWLVLPCTLEGSAQVEL